MKNTQTAIEVIAEAVPGEPVKRSYKCLTCGKTIKFWGTIQSHMAKHGVKITATDVMSASA